LFLWNIRWFALSRRTDATENDPLLKAPQSTVRAVITHALAGLALGVLAIDGPAVAADLADGAAVKTSRPLPIYDWTGLYLGGHFGYGGGSFGPGSHALPSQGVLFPSTVTGLLGGYQIGYNRQLDNHVVLGVEADVIFGSPQDTARPTPTPYNTALDYTATARGRVGYAFGALMPYVTGGVAWGRSKLNVNDADGDLILSASRDHLGWTAGAGVEFAVGGNWTAKVEYAYLDLTRQSYDLASRGLPDVAVDPTIHSLRVGMNYRLGETPSWLPSSPVARPALAQSADWNIHGQTTFIATAYPAIRSPYQGTDSLSGGAQARETFTTTAFLGWRLWQGGELYLNPELAQGFGFNGTTGIAGFPNGEAQKAGGTYPKIRPQRYYFRQTFGLGGEQEDVPDAANQLAGKRDIDRITLTVGRFAVGDFFDGNSYAKDPRADFMNWAMWSSAAYDFPADLPGFTRGAVVELNRKDWAVRAGLFQVPSRPNSDILTFHTGGAVVEFEERHQLFDQPGKLRVGAFANRGNTGNFRNVLTFEGLDPTLDINDVMASLRRDNLKYGFYLNGEQQIAPEVGLFARASWNDGQNESLSFTDIDRSVSAGLSIKGSRWGRANDTIGLGGAINGLSAAHRDFLAAGGIGLMIGDGRLNYGTERILESYYAYAIDKNYSFTADYQLIANPAYNRDRGPVSIFSGRLHGEF
jgi:high affinity Mn2+ porin